MYATCSPLPQENEAIAQAFGLAHPDFESMDVVDLLSSAQVPDAEGLATGEDGQRNLRLWPHRHGTDGFFAAVWQKKAA